MERDSGILVNVFINNLYFQTGISTFQSVVAIKPACFDCCPKCLPYPCPLIFLGRWLGDGKKNMKP